MKRIFISFMAITLLWSCGNDNVCIEGKIKNGKDLSIYLNKLNVDGSELIDSTKLTEEGNFKFKSHTVYPQLYTISLSNGNIITTVVQSEDKLYFEGNAKNFANSYTVKGSDDAIKAKLLNDHLYKTQIKLNTLQKELENKTRDEQEIKTDILKTINAQRKFSSEFIIGNGTSLSSYIALYQKIDKSKYTLNENKDIYYIRVVASSLKALYPESQYTKAILASLKQLNKRLGNLKLRNYIQNAPKTLPEIKLPNINNKEIALSSLKGKYILLDFTDLSSPNSVIINKQYKSLYKKYKNKGFVIYQVSLDRNLLAWKDLIKKQNINWINVWDKDSQNGAAVRGWNVKRMPCNYIISKDFDIAGKNLFGRNLEDKLKEIIR